jgi:hypothetical protein
MTVLYSQGKVWKRGGEAVKEEKAREEQSWALLIEIPIF